MKKGNYEFFWSGPFSQWYKSGFVVDGIKFVCAEQFMMYGKAMLFNDVDIAEKILHTNNAKKQKALGRLIKGFNNDIWESKRESIVYEGNFLKFSQNPELKDILLATYPLTLVEASPEDKIWGIGMDENHPDVLDSTKWKGLNLLGYILTDLRDDFLSLEEILG